MPDGDLSVASLSQGEIPQSDLLKVPKSGPMTVSEYALGLFHSRSQFSGAAVVTGH